MDPITIAGLASAGSSLLGGILGNKSQRDVNAEQINFQERMYDKQFQDNIRLWNMQNDYNSPQEQMKRLQAAGLNPNLVYGKGSSGNSAQLPQSGKVGTPVTQAQKYDYMASSINKFFDLQIKKAQVNNLQAQNTAITTDALLRLDKFFGTDASSNITPELKKLFRKGNFDLGAIIDYDGKNRIPSMGIENAVRRTQLDAFREDVRSRKRANKVGDLYDEKYTNAKLIAEQLNNALRAINVDTFGSLPEKMRGLMALLGTIVNKL